MKKLTYKGKDVKVTKESKDYDCENCIFLYKDGHKCKIQSAIKFEKENKLKDCLSVGKKYLYT